MKSLRKIIFLCVVFQLISPSSILAHDDLPEPKESSIKLLNNIENPNSYRNNISKEDAEKKYKNHQKYIS